MAATTALYWILAALLNTSGLLVWPSFLILGIRLFIAVSGIGLALINCELIGVWLHFWLILFCISYHVPPLKEPEVYRREWTILGLILAGIPLVIFGENLLLYFSILVTLSLLNKNLHVNSRQYLEKSVPSSAITIVAIAHNFHYYSYSVFIVILTLQYGVNKIYFGAVFAIGWAVFLYNKSIVLYLRKKFSLSRLVGIGFILTIPALLLMYIYPNMWSLCVGWGMTSLTAGLSEGFFYFNDFSKNSIFYKRAWMIGGILGCILGGLSASLFGVQSVFILSAVSCIIGFLFTFKIK
ncbi:TPA: hypothetical protein ACOQ4A_000803 [Bacillus cereus]|uniref:hypothetical protein n=1 Tax=Bacillus cereus TaxID=1396 RepID=UPI001115C933|nr:hypothetical protein [Bacillus cereus]NSL61112.1 hypothetical protein [Bacillus cereus]